MAPRDPLQVTPDELVSAAGVIDGVARDVARQAGRLSAQLAAAAEAAGDPVLADGLSLAAFDFKDYAGKLADQVGGQAGALRGAADRYRQQDQESAGRLSTTIGGGGPR